MQLIRVGGRLTRSQLEYDTQHPVVLPSKHPFTLCLMRHLHEVNLHPGPKALLAFVRQQYWPIHGLRLANAVVHKCRTCVRAKPKSLIQQMADLPAERVVPAPPFYTIAIDYAGPFFLYLGIRGRAPVKAYLCIFVCFTTKAVHLEVVLDLTSEAFLAAFRRFSATRGLPSRVYSDNGTQFVGAKSQLHELFVLFNSEQHEEAIKKEFADHPIEWSFAPPSSPNFNGLAESAIKMAKHHLKRTMGEAHLRIEEFLTLVKQVESVLNSRPLCALSSNPNDPVALTPGHFLIRRPLNAYIVPDITNERVGVMDRWLYEQQLEQHFWKRWSTEYLVELQHRRKWAEPQRDIQVGEVVVVKEDNLPPLRWRLERIIEVFPGADGRVRAAKVKTATGVIDRGVVKLCPLPTAEEYTQLTSVNPGEDV